MIGVLYNHQRNKILERLVQKNGSFNKINLNIQIAKYSKDNINIINKLFNNILINDKSIGLIKKYYI